MKRSTAQLNTVPTIVFYLLFLGLHFASMKPHSLFVRYDDGGSTMLVLSAAGLLGLIAQLFLARRRATASWKIALPPAVLVVAGSLFVWMQFRTVREVLADESDDPSQLARIFAEGMAEALNNSILACAVASVALAHATWLVTLRIRERCGRTATDRHSRTTVAAIGIAAIGLLVWRVRSGMSVADGGLLTPIALVGACSGLLVAALALLGFSSVDEQEQHDNWSDFLVATLFGLGSVALGAVAGRAHAISRGYGAIGGESVDPEQKQRILIEAWQNASAETTLGLAAGTLLAVGGFLVLLTRWDAASRAARTGLVPLVGGLIAAVWLPSSQATRLMHEQPEYRDGELNELVVRRAIAPGTLRVALVPLASGTDLGKPAEIKLSIGRSATTSASSGEAEFTKLPTGVPFTVRVESPYLANPAGPFILDASRGARLRLGVLRLAPQVLSQDSERYERVEPEKVLHVDTADPDRYRLTWAAARTVVSTEDLPRDIWALASKVSASWQMFGSHKNDRDQRQDIAVVHYVEPASIDELKSVAWAVGRQERAFRGEMIPAFKVYLLPVQPGERSIDDEVAPSRFASLRPDDAVFQIREALVRCQGRPCRNGQAADVWGLELGQACNVPICGVATVAGLWMGLADALEARGDTADAAEAYTHAGLLNPRLANDTRTAGAADAPQRAAGGPDLPRVRQGALTVNGRLDPKTIGAVVSARMGFFRRCYAVGLHANPNLQGRIAMRFVIGRDGVAGEPGNGGSDLPDASVVQCVLKSAAGLTFPPPEGGIVTVVAPFMFTPR